MVSPRHLRFDVSFNKRLSDVVLDAAQAIVKKHLRPCEAAHYDGFIPFAADTCELIDWAAATLIKRIGR